MTRLTQALEILEIAAETALGGRLAKLQGERCAVYVAEGPRATGFYSWCDLPQERAVKHYDDPVEAIEAGLARAGHLWQREGNEAIDLGDGSAQRGGAYRRSASATEDRKGDIHDSSATSADSTDREGC